jgi:SAM-dependent methyltransferase
VSDDRKLEGLTRQLGFTAEELGALYGAIERRPSFVGSSGPRRRFHLPDDPGGIHQRLSEMAGALRLSHGKLRVADGALVSAGDNGGNVGVSSQLPVLGASEGEHHGVHAIASGSSDPHIEVEAFEKHSTAEVPVLHAERAVEDDPEERAKRDVRVALLLEALRGPLGDDSAEHPAQEASARAETLADGAQAEATRTPASKGEEKEMRAAAPGLRRSGTAEWGSFAPEGEGEAAVAVESPALGEATPAEATPAEATPAEATPAEATPAEAMADTLPPAGAAVGTSVPALSLPPVHGTPFPLAEDLGAADEGSHSGVEAEEDSGADVDLVIEVEPGNLPLERPLRTRGTAEELTGDDLEELAEPPPIPSRGVPQAPEDPQNHAGEVILPLATGTDGLADHEGVITSAPADDVEHASSKASSKASSTASSTASSKASSKASSTASSTASSSRDRRETPPLPPLAATAPTPPPPVAPQMARLTAAGTASASWFEDVFDEDYLRTVPFITQRLTKAEVDFLVESIAPTRDAQLLDLGCGVGRHCLELAARGFQTTGIDRCQRFIDRAKRDAQKRGLKPSFVRQDLRELDAVERFDAAFSLGTSFGYFDDETNRRMLQAVCRSLRPSGRFLLDVANRDYLIRGLPMRIGWEGDGCVVLEEVDLSFYNSRLIGKRSVVFMDGRHIEHDISIRLYSLHELGKLLHLAGFRVMEVSGHVAHKGYFFGNASRSLIVLAERRP